MINTPRSIKSGIVWPAFPGPHVMPIFAILYQLEQTQWLSAREIRELQFAQLKALLMNAKASVPFYRERLADFDIDAHGPLDPEQWRQIPCLRRSEIQDAGERLLSESIPRDHGRTGPIFTSGSTGRPIAVTRTELWSYFRAANTARDHIWHRRDMSGKLAAIRESGKGKALYPEGSVSKGWSPTTRDLFRNGPGVSLNVNTPVEQKVEWLRRERPDYLLTHPTIVAELAEHCIAQGLELPGLRQVETIAEVLAPEVREACQTAWNVPLVDIYSSREAGYLALQCPDFEHYHVQAESIHLEVLDEEGRPCRPGETGSVFVTPLQNFAMPLIRYEIGDYAEVGGRCACGRGLPVLNRILGRTQSMLSLPGGERRWPLLSSGNIEALLAIGPIRQYQIVQKDLNEIEFRLVADRPLTAEEESRLNDWVADKFQHRFHVTVTYHKEIPRTVAGKYFDFYSEVSAG